MRAVDKKTIILLVGLASISLLSGCTNWKKKYNTLNVQYQNTRGLLAYERGKNDRPAERVPQTRQTIEELQQQIAARNQTPAEAFGFGEGYNVTFDASAGTVTVTLANAVLFNSGKVSLKKTTSVELDHIQSVLQRKYHGKQIDVVGHTDSDPIKKSKWQDDWKLSAQRALSIARYLIKRGIAEDKIRTVGCIASRPRASNSTASGKTRNRRVEIVVHIR